MSDMTAYRSTDSDSKDTTDQFLVTKADAEHMYARRAPTRATRPTSHEKLSGSQRSPQPSRHMSRCMPLPRRCTSQAEERVTTASPDYPRPAHAHRPNSKHGTVLKPLIESTLADPNDFDYQSFGAEVTRDSPAPDSLQELHAVDKPDRPCYSDHDLDACCYPVRKQDSSSPGELVLESLDLPTAEPAQATAKSGETKQKEEEQKLLDAALKYQMGVQKVRAHANPEATTKPLATKVVEPAPCGPAGASSLIGIDLNGDITSEYPKKKPVARAEWRSGRNDQNGPKYTVGAQADLVAKNALAYITYNPESIDSTSITKTMEVPDAAAFDPPTVSDAVDSYMAQESDIPDPPKPETVISTTTAEPKLKDPPTPEHYSYVPITREEKDALEDYLKDLLLYKAQEETYQLGKDSNNLPYFTDTRAANGYDMSPLPRHTPSSLHKFLEGLQDIFNVHSLDSKAGVQEAVQSLIDGNYVTGDPRLKLDNAHNIIAACFFLLKPTVDVLEACADTQAGVEDAETALLAFSDLLIYHRDLFDCSNGLTENYSRYIDVSSEITEREKECGTLEELLTRFKSMIEVLTQDNYSKVLLVARQMAAAFEQLFRFSALAQWIIQEAEKPARPDGVSGSTRQDFVQQLAASQVYLRNVSATLEALMLWLADLDQAIDDAPDFLSLITSATFVQLLSHSPVYTERNHRGAIRKLEGPRQIARPAPAFAALEGFPNLSAGAATAPTLLRVNATRLASDASMPAASFYTPLDQATYPTPPNSPESEDDELSMMAELLDEDEILDLFEKACEADAEPAASDLPDYETPLMRLKRDRVRTVKSNPNSVTQSLSAENSPDRRPWSRLPTSSSSDHAPPYAPSAASLREDATAWTPDAPFLGPAYSHVISHASGATYEPDMFSYLALVTQPLQTINAWAGEPTQPCSPPTSPLATSLEAEVVLVEHATNSRAVDAAISAC